MANNTGESNPKEIPFGQRMADSPFILLAAGMICMLVFYTIWGLYEILSLPPSALP